MEMSVVGHFEDGSVLPEFLKLLGRQFGVPDRALNTAVAEIMLKGTGIEAVIGELEPAGMPQHVRMDRKWQLGRLAGPRDHFLELLPRHRGAAFGHEDVAAGFAFALQQAQSPDLGISAGAFVPRR